MNGVCRLLASLLYGLESYMDGTPDSIFLQDMLMGNTLHLLIKVYDRLQRFKAQRPIPVECDAERLTQELAEELHTKEASPEVVELLFLLSKPHLMGLLFVHDAVAQKDYEPELPPTPPLPDDSDEEEESVKIIRLVKSQEPLGATIKRVSTGAIVVARIMKGGAADLSGLIHEGDELREVNGVPVEDKNPEDIIPILAQSDGAVTFKVIPGTKGELAAKDAKVFVRALFDYNPIDDPAIPCKEAGLVFRKGDILEIMSQGDDTWWQARHHDKAKPRAGLIPSRRLQEKRVALRRPEALFHPQRHSKPDTGKRNEGADYGAISGIHVAGLRRSFRLSRREAQDRWRKSDGQVASQFPTYQEVVPYHKEPGAQHRLVLLVGPAGVGVSELKKKLLISDPERFDVAVPHTTRAPRKQERGGVEYHFVSRHTFEKNILERKFIEYGEYKGNYYGTSVNSVHKVLEEHKVCLLDVEPSTIKDIYTAEFKPYVIFVKPPPLEQLQLSRRKAKVISNEDEAKPTKTFTEEDFEDMIACAQVMESEYGHFFEKIIVNDDLAMAFNELRAEQSRLETETQWIPKTWAQPCSDRNLK
ncbi:MAGUK p55 subfamily member 7 [Chanos chanos]|uniref:MAGUK p55 subfamily member 7 n=1 Tax=Chanos chanos TaxID=29144 RepID=A0A6J2VEH8_CHACN|nr:MAGUK p55 subfamily member 7-like [Chanos chanos]